MKGTTCAFLSSPNLTTCSTLIYDSLISKNLCVSSVIVIRCPCTSVSGKAQLMGFLPYNHPVLYHTDFLNVSLSANTLWARLHLIFQHTQVAITSSTNTEASGLRLVPLVQRPDTDCYGHISQPPRWHFDLPFTYRQVTLVIPGILCFVSITCACL